MGQIWALFAHRELLNQQGAGYMSRLLQILAITTALLTLSGCYKMDIQQGNYFSDADVHAIKRGMSPAKVEKVLGSPILKNIYYNNQLAYVYTFKPGHGHMKKRRLIIYFRNGRVTHTTTDFNSNSVLLPQP